MASAGLRAGNPAHRHRQGKALAGAHRWRNRRHRQGDSGKDWLQRKLCRPHHASSADVASHHPEKHRRGLSARDDHQPSQKKPPPHLDGAGENPAEMTEQANTA